MYLDRTKVECLMADKGYGMMKLAEVSGITHKSLKRAFDHDSNTVIVGKIAKALDVKAEVIVKKESTVA